MTLSRRQFLQLSGIALAGSAFTQHEPLLRPFLPPLSTTPGRALTALTVFTRPRPDAPIATTLWPDSVVSIRGVEGDFFRLANGYARRVEVQPMFLPPPAPITDLPGEIEVAAPVAVVREWASTDAPSVTRIGHGGAVFAHGRLPDPRGGADWLHVSNFAHPAHNRLGWTQVSAWRPTDQPQFATVNAHLRLDTAAHTLTVFADESPILSTPYSGGMKLKPGTSGSYRPNPNQIDDYSPGYPPHNGVRWLDFGRYATLVGAYWHNEFGQPRPTRLAHITPQAARWLSLWLPEHATLDVV